MEQNLEYDKKNFNETVANIHNKKLNNCNQCNYASSYANALKTHLKRHTVEKSNKCNQCDYATAYVSTLRAHI